MEEQSVVARGRKVLTLGECFCPLMVDLVRGIYYEKSIWIDYQIGVGVSLIFRKGMDFLRDESVE